MIFIKVYSYCYMSLRDLTNLLYSPQTTFNYSSPINFVDPKLKLTLMNIDPILMLVAWRNGIPNNVNLVKY